MLAWRCARRLTVLIGKRHLMEIFHLKHSPTFLHPNTQAMYSMHRVSICSALGADEKRFRVSVWMSSVQSNSSSIVNNWLFSAICFLLFWILRKRQFLPDGIRLHSADAPDIIDLTSILNFFGIAFNKLQICRPWQRDGKAFLWDSVRRLTLKWNAKTEVDFPQLDAKVRHWAAWNTMEAVYHSTTAFYEVHYKQKARDLLKDHPSSSKSSLSAFQDVYLNIHCCRKQNLKHFHAFCAEIASNFMTKTNFSG